jgi:hypothetical protein
VRRDRDSARVGWSDVVTINYDVFEEPGDYMLVGFGHLLLIRRYTDRGDNDHFDFIPENPAYPLVLDDGAPDPWVWFHRFDILMEPRRHLT